jgi:hypothetical protein
VIVLDGNKLHRNRKVKESPAERTIKSKADGSKMHSYNSKPYNNKDVNNTR